MSELRGAQRPRIFCAPPSLSSVGEEAIELGRVAGIVLDPWQEFILTHSLGEDEDHRWAAFEVGVVASRQQGKNECVLVRELAGLFLFREELIVHSAHEFATSLEAFRRLLRAIEETPDLDRRVRRVSRSHGDEGIELKNGQRIRFRTRTGSGGRGFTADLVVFDEAMVLSEATAGALVPTLSARPNSQIWYLGSAVDRKVHEHGKVFGRVRDRALAGNDPSLAWFEWSLPMDIDSITDEIAADRENWAQANPALGIRIGEEHVANERLSLDLRTFAVERLGVGDWPRPDVFEPVIDMNLWHACADAYSRPDTVSAFAVEVTSGRSGASIACAGRRSDGMAHVDVLEDTPRGLAWVAPELARLKARYPDAAVVLDPKSHASTLLPDLARLGIEPTQIDYKGLTQAHGIWFDLVTQGRMRHLPQPVLDAALLSAETRTISDQWAFDRKSKTDVSPLLAMVLAVWACETQEAKPAEVMIFGASDYERLRQKMIAEGAFGGNGGPDPVPFFRGRDPFSHEEAARIDQFMPTTTAPPIHYVPQEGNQ